jgi:hypothetical protein
MRKIAISDGPAAATAYPEDRGFTPFGISVSHPVISPGSAALSLWRHDLDLGGGFSLNRPREDHLFYVLSGEIEVGDTPMGSASVVCVAFNAEATLRATRAQTVLLHFVGDAPSRPPKPGGCVHLIPQGGVLVTAWSTTGLFKTLYADARCPTCSLWLHKDEMAPGFSVPPHCHSEDEIIAITNGQLMLGARALPADAAIAVSENAYYSFMAGETGLTFLNFRQSDPSVMVKGADPAIWRREHDLIQAQYAKSHTA